jgi:four helix bundle protein
MSNKKQKTKYDLEERTGKFGEAIIEFAQKVSPSIITKPLVTQLVRAGTSVGSNYCEADCAESKKDFEHKLGICKKEAKESKHWLRMISKVVPKLKGDVRTLWREANELQLIFIAIINKSKANRYKKKKN